MIGYVGSSGGSTGPHLHYEQCLNGNDIQVRFNGTLALYWGTRTYTSDSGCWGGARSGDGEHGRVAAVGTVADGAGVTIYCQTTGTTVTGTYGTSNVWDRIGSGRFVADAYVYAGSDGFIPGVPRR